MTDWASIINSVAIAVLAATIVLHTKRMH